MCVYKVLGRVICVINLVLVSLIHIDVNTYMIIIMVITLINIMITISEIPRTHLCHFFVSITQDMLQRALETFS